MKFAIASALLIGTATAFSSPSFVARKSALSMSTAAETEIYTFEKSKEIFAEAKTVSKI